MEQSRNATVASTSTASNILGISLDFRRHSSGSGCAMVTATATSTATSTTDRLVVGIGIRSRILRVCQQMKGLIVGNEDGMGVVVVGRGFRGGSTGGSGGRGREFGGLLLVRCDSGRWIGGIVLKINSFGRFFDNGIQDRLGQSFVVRFTEQMTQVRSTVCKPFESSFEQSIIDRMRSPIVLFVGTDRTLQPRTKAICAQGMMAMSMMVVVQGSGRRSRGRGGSQNGMNRRHVGFRLAVGWVA